MSALYNQWECTVLQARRGQHERRVGVEQRTVARWDHQRLSGLEKVLSSCRSLVEGAAQRTRLRLRVVGEARSRKAHVAGWSCSVTVHGEQQHGDPRWLE